MDSVFQGQEKLSKSRRDMLGDSLNWFDGDLDEEEK